MSKLICFGDSWAAGAELNLQKEQPFVHWIAKELNVPYLNYGKQGSSLGIILHTVISQINNINSDDTVIVIIPPDTRWYDENQEQGFYSLMNWQRDDYFKFVNQKTLEWFKYHHAMFIYTIQKILDDIGCRYVLAHNYGQIDEYRKYQLNINFNNFLSEHSLTELLSPAPVDWKSYPDHLPQSKRYNEDGPTARIFTGQYFQGCECHPNESGHKYIAQLFLEKLASQ
jgi:hypothetical protein